MYVSILDEDYDVCLEQISLTWRRNACHSPVLDMEILRWDSTSYLFTEGKFFSRMEEMCSDCHFPEPDEVMAMLTSNGYEDITERSSRNYG